MDSSERAAREAATGTEAGGTRAPEAGTPTGGAARGASTSSPSRRSAAISGSETDTGAEVAEANALRFSCLMNSSYHAGREAYLDRFHRVIMFAVIVLGAGALTDLGAKDFPWIKEVFAAAVAVLAAIDLVCDLSNRARQHSLMKRRYFELLADFRDGKRNERECRACMDRYSADEEPVYQALLDESWNAAQVAIFGKDAKEVLIPWWHRLLKNVWRFAGSRYDLVGHPKATLAA